jgi:hypothetical protein
VCKKEVTKMVEAGSESPGFTYKDELARDLLKKFEAEGKQPWQLLGELISMNLPEVVGSVNYTYEPRLMKGNWSPWNPAVMKGKDGRDWVFFSGTPNLGRALPVEGLRLGLRFAPDFRPSGSMDNEGVFLVPYLHLDKPENLPDSLPEEARKLGIAKVDFLLLTMSQVKDIRGLIGKE